MILPEAEPARAVAGCWLRALIMSIARHKNAPTARQLNYFAGRGEKFKTKQRPRAAANRTGKSLSTRWGQKQSESGRNWRAQTSQQSEPQIINHFAVARVSALLVGRLVRLASWSGVGWCVRRLPAPKPLPPYGRKCDSEQDLEHADKACQVDSTLMSAEVSGGAQSRRL